MSDASLYDLPTEKAVLGILVSVSSTSVKDARVLIESTQLDHSDFANDAHVSIFQASKQLLSEGLPVDVLALTSRLKDSSEVTQAGGAGWLESTLVTESKGLQSSFTGYVATLKGLGLRRRLVKELKVGLSRAFDHGEDPAVALAHISGNINRITQTTKTYRTLTEVVHEDLERELAAVQKGEATGFVATGISSLDNIVGGFPRAMVTVVAADTGVGKSAFLSTVVEQIALRGKKVLIFSLEDEAPWIGWRILSKRSGVDQFVLRFRKKSTLELDRIDLGKGSLLAYGDRVFVDDRPGLRPEDIVLTAHEAITNHGVDVIFADHMGEINCGNVSERYDLRIGHAVSMFRDLAKSRKVPFVLASQVTTNKEIERGKLPDIRDIKNSREIANKARLVLGLGRRQGSDSMQIGILKQTNGMAGGTIEVEFLGAAAMLEA
jgi:replicative DNA helicase